LKVIYILQRSLNEKTRPIILYNFDQCHLMIKNNKIKKSYMEGMIYSLYNLEYIGISWEMDWIP